MNINSDSVRAPLLCSSRLMIVICLINLIINITYVRVSFSYNYLCMSHSDDDKKSNQKVNLTEFNEKHGVGTFNWSRSLSGLLLSSYLIGFVASCIIGGYISDVCGGRKPLLWGNAIQSLCILTELFVVYFSPYAFFVVRLVNGFFSGISFSPVYNLYSKWLHPSERVLLFSLTFAGFPLGTVITFPTTAFLCQHGFRGWESNFYLPALWGIFSELLYYFYIHDGPSLHPRISEIEKKFLTHHSHHVAEKPTKIPWFQLLTSLPVIAYAVSQTAQVWNWHSSINYLPTFYKEAFFFTSSEIAAASCSPFIGLLIVRITIALSFNKVYLWSSLSLTRFRKIYHVIGTVIPSLVLLVVTKLDSSHKLLAVSLIILNHSIVDFAISGGYLPSVLDLAPQYSSIISGISSSFGISISTLSPVIVSQLTKNHTKEEWSRVLYIQVGFLLFSCVFYEIFGSSERLKWTLPTTAVTNEDATIPAVTSRVTNQQ